MKHSIKLTVFLMLGGTHSAFADYVPYTKLYVGYPYNPQIPVASFTSSLPAPKSTGTKSIANAGDNDPDSGSTDAKLANLSISGPMYSMFQSKYGNVMVNGPIQDLSKISNDSHCTKIYNNPNSVLCTYTVTAYGKTVSWPVWFYNGLRAKTIEEMVSERSGGEAYQIDTSKPYYYEISATSSDFAKASTDSPTQIVALSNYFTSNRTMPAIDYTLDASLMLGNTQTIVNKNNNKICAVQRITGLNKVSCADDSFKIDDQGNLTAVSALENGIYQINVVAVQKFSDATPAESDYQTFYINVNDGNPALGEWLTGAVASTNVIGQFPSVYVYSSKDPAKGDDWDADYKSYVADLGQINKTLKDNPIKTVFFEMINVMYPGKNQTWQVGSPPADVSSQIQREQITTNRGADLTWISKLKTDFNGGPGITMSYTFDNLVKAAMVGFNDKQQQFVAELMVEPIFNFGLDGVSMDLEGGFNQPAATALFKKINDRLAYQGKWFSFYYFSDIFGPSMIAAFGPLGVANISTYDVGQYRAPQNFSQQNMLPGSLAYAAQMDNSPWTTDLLNQLFDNFSNDGSCNTVNNSNLYSPVSYCNLTTNDSVSENTRRFTNTYHTISTQDAMIHFNGKYQLAFPLAASATEWEAIEIWNPDLDLLSKKAGILSLNKQACAGLSNQWLNDNEDSLNQNSSDEYKKLSSCLMMDSQFNIGDVSYQTWSKCGALPLSQCLKVSNLPSSTNDGVIGHPSVLDYVKQNMSVYCQTNADHYVGYSVFALENTGTAAQGAFGAVNASVDDSGKCIGCNLVVQEPWYLGFQTQALPDPYYNQSKSGQVWQGFAKIVSNLSTCEAPTPPSQTCDKTNFSIQCHGDASKNLSINYDIDPSAYSNGVCLGYCYQGQVTVTDTGTNNTSSVNVDIGTGIYVNSAASQCYDNNGKNGGNNIGSGTTGIFVTQQNNQPKCTIQGDNPSPKS